MRTEQLALVDRAVGGDKQALEELLISVQDMSITLVFSACGGSSRPTTPSESAESPAISSEQAETSSSRIAYTEEDMPMNTTENEAYLKQYVIPFGGRGTFEKNYGPDNHEALSDSLLAKVMIPIKQA